MFKYLLIHSSDFTKEFSSYDEMIEDFVTYKNPQFCRVFDYDGYNGREITAELMAEYYPSEEDEIIKNTLFANRDKIKAWVDACLSLNINPMPELRRRANLVKTPYKIYYKAETFADKANDEPQSICILTDTCRDTASILVNLK